MAIQPTGQPLTGVVQPPLPSIQPSQHISQTIQPNSYSSIIKPNEIPRHIMKKSITEPKMDLHHGEPSFVWEDTDVENMMFNEDLQYAVVGKFAYGMPDFHEVKKQIPVQLELKGECSIGFLESRHVLIRLSLLEDYVHLLSHPAFYIKIGHRLHQMRALKYEVWFDPNEETSIGIAWISFPGLPPVFFGKESIFSMATAMGRPLQLDAATKFKTRPSCAKVKVEVNLVAHRPQRIRIGIKNSTNTEIKYKWIRVRYDYIPKYCKECKLQGHDEVECYVLHPELIPKEEQAKVTTMAAKEMNVKGSSSLIEPAKEATMKVLQSGKVVGNVPKGEEVVVPTHVHGHARQEKNFKKFIHPNRNPNAWTRVENKSKQNKVDATRVDQRETVATTNAFALLENDDEAHDGVETSQLISQDKNENLIQYAAMENAPDQSRHDDFVTGKEADPAVTTGGLVSHNTIGTKGWALESFQDHPKVKEVGISVVSGKGKERQVVNAQAAFEAVVLQHSALSTPASPANVQGTIEADGILNSKDMQCVSNVQGSFEADGIFNSKAMQVVTGNVVVSHLDGNLHVGDKTSHVHVHTLPSAECVGFTKNNAHTLPSETEEESHFFSCQTEDDTHAEEHGNMESHDIVNIQALNTYAEEHALAMFNTPLVIKNDTHALTSQNVEKKQGYMATHEIHQALTDVHVVQRSEHPHAFIHNLVNNVHSLDKIPSSVMKQDDGQAGQLVTVEGFSPGACARGTDVQLQLNVPLKSPVQVLNDLITHNVKPTDVQKAIIEQQQMEEDDDESTTGNLIQTTKEGDLSPRGRAKSGKKGKKHIQHAEPTRQMTRRMASKSK